MEEDYYQMLSQALNAGYNPYLPQYGQTQPAELYELQQPQQQQGGGMDIGQAMNIYDMFAGGGAGAGAGSITGGGLNYGVASSPAAGGGTWYGPFAEGGIAAGGGSAAGGGAAAGGSAAGSAGGAAGGSGASMLSTLGPWAALAAIIYANEREARRGGYRSEDDTQYAKDVLGGKAFEQDVSKRWAPKLESMWGGLGSQAQAAADFGTGDFSNAFSNLNQSLKDDPIIGALRGLF